MGIYDKIIKMLGIESPEEKLYKVLLTITRFDLMTILTLAKAWL